MPSCKYNIVGKYFTSIVMMSLLFLQTGYSCVPNSSDNLTTQTHIVHSFAQYIMTEALSDKYTFPDRLSNLLSVINTTLPTPPILLNDSTMVSFTGKNGIAYS